MKNEKLIFYTYKKHTMKTTLKRITILLVLISASYSGFSQFHAAFEFSSTNKVGLGYRFSERIWTELSFYESFETEHCPSFER